MALTKTVNIDGKDLTFRASAVIMSEMILYILRQEFRTEGIRTVMHPRFYKGIEPNMKCPCGSGIKYKKCCRNEVDQILYNAEVTCRGGK